MSAMQNNENRHPVTVEGKREQAEANIRVLAAAHGAPVNQAMDSVRWERRGFLERLTRRAA
ncbi:MAG: hypothetical protein ACJ76V_03575 [Thermoleophilaceae bacterium]